ncbi:tape measure protein [Nocardia terpenica]|uniref:Tape measure protein N-terminal domain-containing protein n=1 Tax=Nocardia terpenica TaxID=455432 RepID=A0A291RTC0_9NOCA|nr:tape measure protein [Nocardia terpenica]ATL70786.1 hypothetical protein CRH09_35990 [Nocardia terpenica]
MAVELATAYVSLVIGTKDVAKQVEAGFRGTAAIGKSAGQGMGREMASGVGETLRTGITSAVGGIPFAGLLTGMVNKGALGGAVAAATVAGGTIATALTKGFDRLTAIDTAQGKLAGLGNDTQTIAGIMDSALTAVKGTAYGLGDASTIAASAVAAGIKPGEQLTNYLKLTADAASIAGSSLGEMGHIINKVQTAGKAYTDDLNMLSDRGLPIFQWLQTEYKVNADQLRKMVEQGKVDSATFQKVIQQNIGGAAQAAGKTFRGSLDNLGAALGRLGAAAEQPTFNRMTGWLNTATGSVDKFTPRVTVLAKELDSKVFTEWGPKLAKAFNEIKSSDSLRNNLSRLKSDFEQLVTAGSAAAPAIKEIVQSLAQASAATGFSAWQVFLAVLESTAQIANSVLVPAVNTLAGLMKDNQGAVTALAVAFAAFKTWPTMLAAITPQTRSVASGFSSLRASLTGFREEMTLQRALMQAQAGSFNTAAPFLSLYGREAEKSGRKVSTMGAAYAAASVKVQGALSGLRSAGAGVMSALGGPWGMALAAGGAALVAYQNDAAQARRVQEALSDAVVAGAKAQSSFKAALDASNGALTDQASQAASKLVEAQLAAITKVADAGHTPWSSFQKHIFTWNGEEVDKQYDAVQRAIDQNDTLKKVLRDQKLEMSDLGGVVAKGGPAYDNLIAKLQATGDSGSDVVKALTQARDTLQRAADQAKNSTPGFGQLSDAFKTVADSASTADQRLNAMKRALDILSGRPIELGDAMQSYNQVIRQTTQATQGLADASQGLGQQLVNQDGSINTKTANGDRLRTSLLQIRDATLDVAKAGGDLGPVYANNTDAFAKLGKQFGLTTDQVTALATSIGYLPDKITMLAELKGASDATEQLALIKSLLDKDREGVEIPTDALTDDTKKKLDELGVKITDVTGKPGIIKVTADNAEALKKLQELIDKQLPDKTQRVNLEYQAAVDASGGKWHAPMVIPPQPRAGGGPIFGAGGPTSDSNPAMLSTDEHVWTARETAAVGGHRAMYGLRALALSGGLKFATGGSPATGAGMPFGISEAIKAAQEMEGHKYQWGGIGPNTFDCSGFISFLQQVAMGLGRVTKRLYTTNTILDGATAGLKPGIGPSDTWFRVGVSAEHMAATIAGLNVESGGALGTSGIGGGRAGAGDSQFPNKFYLPNELIAGFGTNLSGGKLIEWTPDDEIELQKLQIAVDEAKQKRDKTYADAKATDTDKRKADLDVHDAQSKVVKKQEQKDKRGQVEGGTRVAPQAPALQKQYSDDEKRKAELLQAVESANKSRNEIYDNPESTDTDKQVADIKLQDAIDALEKGKDSQNTKSPVNTVKDVFTSFASNMAGVVFDAFKAQLPEQIGSSRWWDVADQAVALSHYNNDDSKTGTSVQDALSNIGSFGADAFLGQLGYTKKNNEIPDWVKKLKGAAVYDAGGWLPPGGMAVNLSSTPEPIFNSPQQLRAFAGSQLQPAQRGNLTEQDLERYMRLRPVYHITTADVSGAVQQIRTEQKRQAKTYMRR